MQNQDKGIHQQSQTELRNEVVQLRRRIAEMEIVELEGRRLEKDLDPTFCISPIPMCIVGVDGYIKRANAACEQTYGYTEAELLGRPHLEFFHPDDAATSMAFISHLLKGEPVFNVETRICRPDGSIRYLLWAGIPLAEAGGIVCIGQDITERKQAQVALQQAHEELERRVEQRTAELSVANEQLRAIYDQVVDGIIIVDAARKNPILANPAYCRMLDYSAEEALTLSPERVHPPEVLPAVWLHLETAQKGNVARISDLPFLRKDGTLVYADVVTSPICYNDRPCWISFFHDVSERRRVRIALERERRTLEHMLQASDHERQLIAYDIHDGLAQELAGAIMQFQMYDHQKDTKPQDARKAFDGGVALLRQSHIEARRLISGVRPPILDESGLLAAIAHLVHDPAFDGGPKVDFRSRVKFSRLAPVVENVIYRIVQEGLTNARNHSKSKTIRIRFMQRGDRLRIEIRDWGIGFNPKNVQANRFGLEGIRERARLLGGKCSMKSKPGKGTAVVVELPVAERRRDE